MMSRGDARPEVGLKEAFVCKSQTGRFSCLGASCDDAACARLQPYPWVSGPREGNSKSDRRHLGKVRRL